MNKIGLWTICSRDIIPSTWYHWKAMGYIPKKWLKWLDFRVVWEPIENYVGTRQEAEHRLEYLADANGLPASHRHKYLRVVKGK